MELKKMNKIIAYCQEAIARKYLFNHESATLSRHNIENDGRKLKKAVRELYNLNILASKEPDGDLPYIQRYFINEEEILDNFPGKAPNLMEYFDPTLSRNIRPDHLEYGVPLDELLSEEELWVATHTEDYKFCLWNQWKGAEPFEPGDTKHRGFYTYSLLISNDEYEEKVKTAIRDEKLERLKEINVPWAFHNFLGCSEEESKYFTGESDEGHPFGRDSFSKARIGPDPEHWAQHVKVCRERVDAKLFDLKKKRDLLRRTENILDNYEEGLDTLSFKYRKALEDFLDKDQKDED